jgi:hypothetical protein
VRRKKEVYMASCKQLFILALMMLLGSPNPIFSQVRGYWPLDEGAGTVAHDMSGNGNDGILKNGATWVTGNTGFAVEFDGINDFINVSDNASLDISTNLSIDVWIKPYSNDKLMNILGKWGISGCDNRSFVLNIGGWPLNLPHGAYPGRVCLVLTPDGKTEYILPSAALIPINVWTHVVAEYQDSTMAIYFNGVLDTTRVVSMGDIFVGNAKFQVAATESEPTAYKFDGVIDEVSVAGELGTEVPCPPPPPAVPILSGAGSILLLFVLVLAAVCVIRRQRHRLDM